EIPVSIRRRLVLAWRGCADACSGTLNVVISAPPVLTNVFLEEREQHPEREHRDDEGPDDHDHTECGGSAVVVRQVERLVDGVGQVRGAKATGRQHEDGVKL